MLDLVATVGAVRAGVSVQNEKDSEEEERDASGEGGEKAGGDSGGQHSDE